MQSSFTVLGITLYPYSLLMVLGAVVSLVLFAVLSCHRHRNALDENLFAIEMLIISVVAALPASMLLDALFKIQEKGAFELEGATFYGGLLCALLIFPLLLCAKKKRTIGIYDRLCDFTTCIPIGHFFGRIGCFLGGCCYGIPTDGPFGVIFPEGSLPYQAYGDTPLHPTQLYEAFFLLILFVVLLLCGKKRALPLYLILYGIGRCAIECLRGDDRGQIGNIPLSPAQIISLALIVAGCAILVIKAVREYNRQKQAENEISAPEQHTGDTNKQQL